MSLLLILLIIAFLVVGGFGFVAHVVWWALIGIAVLIVLAYFFGGSRSSGPPV